MNGPKTLPVIGINALVSIGERAFDIPAKIDTGADSSSIWATDIKIQKNGALTFKLFGPGHLNYTGETIQRTDYKVVNVKNSFGQTEIRYRTHFPIEISGKKIIALINLSDRSKNRFKILIGRRTIAGKFLVDANKRDIPLPKPKKTHSLNQESAKNPYKFYKKYVKTTE